jgi:ABC-type nitrate/sulfonate/bicarbonate transport system ATPase subunit
LEQDHKTVIILTHDIEGAIPLSDRIFVLNGPPAEIVDEFQAPFGRPRDPSLALGEDSLDLKRRIRSKLGRGVLIPEGSLK